MRCFLQLQQMGEFYPMEPLDFLNTGANDSVEVRNFTMLNICLEAKKKRHCIFRILIPSWKNGDIRDRRV